MCFDVDRFYEIFRAEFERAFPGDDLDIHKDTRVNLYVHFVGENFLIKVSKSQISIFQKKNFAQIEVLTSIIDHIIRANKEALQLNSKFTAQHLQII